MTSQNPSTEDKKFDVTIDSISVLHPLIAAQLLNSFYSSLLLKKLSGVEITLEERTASMNAVFSRWGKMLEYLKEEHLRHLKKSQEESPEGTSQTSDDL